MLVRSTIHLPEIGRNTVVRVDPSRPYIAGALERGYLVPVAPTAEPADADDDADDAAQADAQLALERVEAVDDTES